MTLGHSSCLVLESRSPVSQQSCLMSSFRYVFLNFSASPCNVDTNYSSWDLTTSVGKPLFTICSQGINSRLITNTQPPTPHTLSIHLTILSFLAAVLHLFTSAGNHTLPAETLCGRQTYSSYLLHLLQGQQCNSHLQINSVYISLKHVTLQEKL